MKCETSHIVSMRHLMRNAEPVSPTREVRRRLVAHDCMTNNDSLAVPILHPYVYIKDYLGSVRLTVDAIANNNGTGNARQGMEYLPSGAVFRSTNYAFQPRRFCGKELMTMHGWNMYDSNARFQHSTQPRFSSLDPLAEWDYATSPYAYCMNDFVNLVDPLGLFSNLNDAIDFGNRAYPGNYTIINNDGEWEVMSYIGEAIVSRRKNTRSQEKQDYADAYYIYDESLVAGHGGGGGFNINNSGYEKDVLNMDTKIGSGLLDIEANRNYNKKEWLGINSKTGEIRKYTIKRAKAKSRYITTRAQARAISKLAKGVSRGLSGTSLLITAYDSYCDYDEGHLGRGIIRMSVAIGEQFVTDVVSFYATPQVGIVVGVGLGLIDACFGDELIYNNF